MISAFSYWFFTKHIYVLCLLHLASPFIQLWWFSLTLLVTWQWYWQRNYLLKAANWKELLVLVYVLKCFFQVFLFSTNPQLILKRLFFWIQLDRVCEYSPLTSVCLLIHQFSVCLALWCVPVRGEVRVASTLWGLLPGLLINPLFAQRVCGY